MVTRSNSRSVSTEDVKVKPANLRRQRPVLSERRQIAIAMIEAEMEALGTEVEEVVAMFTPTTTSFSASLFDCLVESDKQLAERLLGWEV